MIDFSELYIISDQPVVCPLCSFRTTVELDLSHTKDETQIHECINILCKKEFIVQYDEDFDNGSLS